MGIINELQEAAVSHLHFVLRYSAANGGVFRSLLTTKIGGVDKPLLLFGTAHSKFEDGHCTAILNPDLDLANELSVSKGVCLAGSLPRRVKNRCDAAVNIWNDAYMTEYGPYGRILLGGKYKAREFRPAKFTPHVSIG